jgi:type I restriction enzyme S subunit
MAVKYNISPLNEVCSEIIDCVNKTAPVVDYETPYKMIRTTNVKKGYVDVDTVRYVTKETFDKWTRRTKPKRNDVILTREAPLGEIGLLRSDDNIFLGQRLIQYRVNPEIMDQLYLYYAFQDSFMQGQIRSYGSGATVEHLRIGDCETIKVKYPNLPTQKKLASILSSYDDLIENNNLRIKLLENMAEEIYKEWFVRFRFPGYQNAVFLDKEGNKVAHGTKGAIPEGWENTQLKNHIEYYRGKSYSSAELRDDEGLAMLNLKNVNRQGGFRRDGLKYFEGKYNPNNEAYSGDIIMAITDMTQEREIVGRVARVPDMGIDKFIISMDLIRIEPIKLPKLFTYCFFRFSGIGYQLKEFANGANVLHLTPSLIDFQKAIIPDVEICRYFEKIVEPMITEIDLLNNKNQILQETRDLLLPRLISGKLSLEDLEM